MSRKTQGSGAATGGALIPSTTDPKRPVTDLEQAFEADLKQGDLAPRTVQLYMGRIRRFLKYVGNERLDRVGDDAVKAFFKETAASKKEQRDVAFLIGRFLRFAAARRPPQQRSEIQAKELSVEQLKAQKEAADDLIAKLGRRLIDHYLFFQARLQGQPESIDELTRLVDDCRELIQSNLPLFMSLSAQGRNVHSIIDQRSQQ